MCILMLGLMRMECVMLQNQMCICAACEATLSGLPCSDKIFCDFGFSAHGYELAVFLYLVGLSSFSACTRFSCDAHLRYAGTGFTWVQLRSPTAVHRRCACQELVTGFSASHKCALATTQLCSCVQIGWEPSSDSEIAHIFSPNLPFDIKLPVFLSVALVAHVVQPSFCNERFTLLRYLSV